MCLGIFDDARPYRAQKARPGTIASPRDASILRRTRYHACRAGLSAQLFVSDGRGVAIPKHSASARDRCLDSGAARKKRNWGSARLQGAVRSPLADAERSRGQGKLARGSLGIAAAPHAQGLRCCLRQGKPDRLREKRHGKQDAVYCRVFAVGIPDVRTDRRASRGSRLLSAICHGGDPPGARSPGRSSLRSWRAGRPLVDGFRGSLRMVPRRFQ
jgi:hypothetical protein